jgi:hypothetical protein
MSRDRRNSSTSSQEKLDRTQDLAAGEDSIVCLKIGGDGIETLGHSWVTSSTRKHAART